MKITVLIIVAIALCPPAAQAQVLLPWTVEQVFPNATWPNLHLGAGTKVVFDASTGLPIVASLDSDSNSGALSFARYTSSIGIFYWQRFGTNITTAPDIDLDYWESPTEWKIGVSYRDLSDASLRFVEYRYVKATQQGSFLNHKVLDTTFGNDGIDSSFKYDSQGHAHIAAYTFAILGDDSLRYATWVGSGGNCGFDSSDGEWQCQTVDTGETVGREPSLVLDSSDEPIIGYIKPYGTDQVFVAQTTSSGGGNCGSNSSAGYWNCIYVDYAGNYYIQSNPSVFVDRSAAETGLHVAWDSEYPPTGVKALKHGIWVGAGAGDCGINQEWQCRYVAETGTSDGDVALAVNGRGLAVIAYRDSAANLLMLAEDTGSSWTGNCGQNDQWQCDILGTDATSDTLGEWIDIDVDRNGVPIVAYSHYLETQYDYNLMLTYPWLMRDSFESGDFGAWSSNSGVK